MSAATVTCCMCDAQYSADERHDCPRPWGHSFDEEFAAPEQHSTNVRAPQAPARPNPPSTVRTPRAPVEAGSSTEDLCGVAQLAERPAVNRVVAGSMPAAAASSLAVREAPALPAIERVKALLAECVSVDEAKDIRDQAVAVATYYRQRSDALEIQNDAAEIRLRAERRLGELLKTMPKNPGHRFGGDTASPPALEDIGITKRQSSVWQRIAALAVDDFEERIAELRENGIEVTTGKVLQGPPPAGLTRTREVEEPPQDLDVDGLLKALRRAVQVCPDAKLAELRKALKYALARLDDREHQTS